MKDSIKESLLEIFQDRVAFHKIERLVYSADMGTLPEMITNLINNIPDAVVRPVNDQELAALVSLADKEKMPLIPRGGGSAGYGGAVPTRGGIVADLSGMKRILNINHKEHCVTVESGITMEALDKALRKEGLALRLYPGSAISATMGGWLANGGGIGIGSYEYGFFRDNVMEVELITPEGIQKINREQLDLVDAMAGATGFIYSITMLVRDAVKDIPLAAAFPSINGLSETFQKIREAKMPLWEVSYKDMLNIEWSAKAEAEQAKKGPIVHEIHERPPFPANQYIATFVYPENRKDIVKDQLSSIVQATGGEILSQDLADLEWSEKYFGTRLKAIGPSTVPTEVIIPTDRLADYVNTIKNKLPDLAFFGTLVAEGKESAFMGYRLDDERRLGFPLAFVKSFIPIKEALKIGGRTYTVGMLLVNYADYALGRERLNKTWQYKQSVDPDGIMNPGKVFPASIDNKSPIKKLAFMTKMGAGGLQSLGAGILDSLVGGTPQGLNISNKSALSKMPFGKELAWDAFACASCGYCRIGCTEYQQLGWESSSPRGKFKFLREYINGKIDFDERMAELIFACSTCGKCDNICQVRASIDAHWSVTARPLVWQSGFNPPAVVQGGARNIAVGHNPGDYPQSERAKWRTPDLKTLEEGEIGYFAGCNPSFAAGVRNLPVNAVRLFNKAGIEPVYMGSEEWCCGGALFNVGCWKDAVENVKHNIEEMNRRGIKTLVTSCAGCWANIAHFYPVMAQRLGIPFDLKIKHIVQMSDQWIKEGKLVCKSPVDMEVTYHDPCHIGHAGGIFDEPRNILASIPGLKVREMERSREDAACCGRFLLRYPNYGMKIQMDRLDEAVATGTQALVTACPTCETNFRTGVKENKADFEVFDITDMLCQSVGLPTLVMTKFMKYGVF
ncbi:MAG: FAD-binding and (Fe-S)-binding domain-containing protein [Syntrophomonadaceae bacterium]|nr:FAD-binding and (Fe-S)-binding domain-containing protein [Syntrophomonadaceae bacterium]